MTEELRAIAERIQKLLRLSTDGGATEAEAALAAEKAQEIMATYNLTMAEIESVGGSTGDEGKREKKEVNQAGLYKWQRSLMEALGRTNYCVVMFGKRWMAGKKKKVMRNRNTFSILGRAANVAAVTVTFDYISTTMARLIKEQGVTDRNWAHSFSVGCVERLIERIERRHLEILREQERQAEARRKASPNTANALVVLSNWEASEADLNNDFRRGWAPGTTAANRAQYEAEEEEERQARRAKKAELMAQGIPENVADYMAQGFSRERAEEFCKPKKPQTAREREKEEARWRRYWDSQERKQEREASRLNRDGYYAGRNAGERIGLDPQVGSNPAKRLT